jgi:hypothetical protein
MGMRVHHAETVILHSLPNRGIGDGGLLCPLAVAQLPAISANRTIKEPSKLPGVGT